MSDNYVTCTLYSPFIVPMKGQYINCPPVRQLRLRGLSGLCAQIKESRLALRDFLGGAVVKNPSANAGDTGSSPGPGRSHMPWSN